MIQIVKYIITKFINLSSFRVGQDKENTQKHIIFLFVE